MTLSNAGARAVLLVPDCEGIHSTDLLTWKQFGQNRVGVNRWYLDVDRNLEDFRDPKKKQESHGNAEVFCCHGFYSFHNIAQHLQESMYCGTRNRKVMAFLKTKETKTHQDSVGVLPNLAIAYKSLGLKNLDSLYIEMFIPMVRPHVLP